MVVNIKAVGVQLAVMGMLVLVSCEPEKKPQDSASPSSSSPPPDQGTTLIELEPGEAGGMIEDTISVTATVSAVDKNTRKLTLTGPEGNKVTFTAGPEIRNFDQLQVGDKVEATLVERLKVFVRSGGEDPSISHSAALARAPQGARPGVMAGEVYEIVASVKSIDTQNRTATLLFADGQTRTVPVRRDVDLSRYRVGDNVVIRVSLALSVLAEKP
jgi:hypothetical protein